MSCFYICDDITSVNSGATYISASCLIQVEPMPYTSLLVEICRCLHCAKGNRSSLFCFLVLWPEYAARGTFIKSA